MRTRPGSSGCSALRPPRRRSRNGTTVGLKRSSIKCRNSTDRLLDGNRISRLLRDRSLAFLGRAFPRADSLIELGCGTGAETLPLLRAGHEILALDLSTRMLEVVRAKARAEGLSERLRTIHGRAGDLQALVGATSQVALSGGFSTFGAMNCEPDLARIARALDALLPPGGRFVAGFYNRWCVFELAAYAVTLRPRRALARHHRPVAVGSSRYGVDFFAYSVGDFRRSFGRAFTIESVVGVPVVLPPPDLVAYADRFSRHFDSLGRLDAGLGARFPLSHLGDHTLLLLERSKRQNGGGPAG